MLIKSAVFLLSNTDYKNCPDNKLPDIAFIGRSNVGKSSLINMLAQKSNLAMTSATPGKTQLINHFLINNKWHLVDLPGYGYARLSKEQRGKMELMIKSYLIERETLHFTFVLIDIRHAPQAIDIAFLEWLGTNQVPFAIVFTKTDKISQTAASRNVAAYKEKLKDTWEELPPIFLTSSEKNIGRDEILTYIEQIL